MVAVGFHNIGVAHCLVLPAFDVSGDIAGPVANDGSGNNGHSRRAILQNVQCFLVDVQEPANLRRREKLQVGAEVSNQVFNQAVQGLLEEAFLFVVGESDHVSVRLEIRNAGNFEASKQQALGVATHPALRKVLISGERA